MKNERARNYYGSNSFRKFVFKNKIHGNTHVKEAQIGYATLTASTSNNQVLAPTWNLKTEQKQDFFVNAIEGQVMELGEKENQVVDEHTGVRKNGLHFSVLASGSTGNMLYVGTDEKITSRRRFKW